MPKKLIVKPPFKNQQKRIDVFQNMIHNYSFEQIITNNGSKINDKRYQGFVYETISIILAINKCLNINFSKILVGKFEEYDTLQILDNVIKILDIPIQQGNDKSDMTLLGEKEKRKIVFSIKYRDNESADIDNLGVSTLKLNCRENDKIGLIVKDKKCITEHRYNTTKSMSKELLYEIIRNGLLLDEIDIKNGYIEFKRKFGNKYYNKLEECLEYINSNYLNNSRQLLILKLREYAETFSKIL